ncbi:MAG TPA: Ig-like domain-containing protein, partial [Gemmatimonadaceae bacterium]|nr:Ig-like domain-containing protein [Gemmatimonadaceae bacterium]
MEVDVLDQVGATMLDAPRGYDSSDPAVASVAADGTITGVSAGSASVTVRSGDASIAVPVSVLGARTTVSGRLVSTAAPTQPLRVSVRLPRSQQEWAAATASDGTYSFDAAIPSGATDTVTLAIDAASADRRTHRPILDAVPSPGLAARTQRPLLVPRQVQLPAYAFGGGVQTVSLDEAFTRVCTTQSDANCNSFFPNAWLAIGPTLWAEAQLPIPVVFDRAGSTGTISLGDSVALWAVLHGMEASLGRTLFRPARPEEVPAPLGGFSTGAILVAIDGNLQGFAGWTNWYWGADLHMRGARIRVRAASLLGNESLVTHEFLHAMGFHHTCAWPTVMGGYGCPVAPGATRQDVAAFLLAYQLRRTVLASSPTTSLLAALQGERVLENGLAPALVDDRIVAARRLRVGSSALFTDGAP